jgi:peptidoglycan/xylan/chitin deacetylase (PgdA/CDA1 family)
MKRLLMPALFRVIHWSGRFYRDGGITILSYHSIDEHDTGISVSPRLFEAQMATLAEEGCPTFTMAQVAERMREGSPFPPRAVAITFDDAFANVATLGAPVLRRYGLSATVYVITGMVGRSTTWTAYGAALPSLPIMDWAQIMELQALGFEIGAHTASHGFLTQLSQVELERELCEPKSLLERELGAPVVSFAYPQGDYDVRVVRAVRRAGYQTAVTVDQGRATSRSDPFRLPRVHVGANTTPAVLKGLTAPTVGPAYRVINLVVRGLLGRRSWPRPDSRHIQSTGSVPLIEQ